MTEDNIITYDDFAKLELRVATIRVAERVPESDKLIRLEVDLGSELGERQIIAGIGTVYEAEQLIGTQIIVIVNLKPRKLMGLESQGMLLAAHDDVGRPVLLRPDGNTSSGSSVS